MNKKDVEFAFQKIANTMKEYRDYLVSLDQQNGDGDLGISMDNGFAAAYETIKTIEDIDLGIIFNKMANSLNEAAPSSLGTIITFLLKGIAKTLKGKQECSIKELTEAINNGINNISEKTGSKAGQKTILDSLIPAVETLTNNLDKDDKFQLAADAAKQGSENTKQMRAVWGRAAYYGDNSIGVIDGGSVVGYLIFASLI